MLNEYSTDSTPTGSAKDPVSLWTEAFGGCKPDVRKLVLKGTGEARGKPPKSQAWLRSRRVSPNEADVNLRENNPLSRILPKGLPPTGQRPNLDVWFLLKGYQDWLHHPTNPRVSVSNLAYLTDGRDTAKRGMGCIGNRHLNDFVKSISVNVGESQLDDKESSHPRPIEKVGAAIVVRAWENHAQGEGPQERDVPRPHVLSTVRKMDRANQRFQKCSAQANGVNLLDGAGEEKERDDDSDGHVASRKATLWKARCRETGTAGLERGMEKPALFWENQSLMSDAMRSVPTLPSKQELGPTLARRSQCANNLRFIAH
jgi:hypothetical protein